MPKPKKTNKKLIILAVLIILAGFGYYFYHHNQAKAPSDSSEYQAQQNQSQQPTNNINPVPAQKPSAASSAGQPKAAAPGEGGETTGSNIQVTEVDFDGSQFSPGTVNIKVNDYVFFKNKSTVDFWPASNPHPTHTDYPGFDALKAIPPGGEYKFQFTKVGNWGYHDHLDPAIGGTVVVSQ